jgi:DNA-binding SARP family transcriptional activator/tetratricopeptide (TPR) repeat protein
MDSPKLTFSLLGPPLITLGDKPIQIKRRKVRFLAYYLACQEFPVTRESLCDLFWPGRPEEEARKNLREAFSHLRNSLPGNDYLVIRGEYISLDPGKIFVDVHEFEKIISLIRKNLDISNNGSFSEVVFSKVREGINLWRASGFVSGAALIDSENFQRWASDKSEILESWHQMMLEWLADHCISSGNLNEALTWLSLALLHDRLNTELNLLVLSCLRELGAWSELQHFCEMLATVYQENGHSILPRMLNDSIERSKELVKNPVYISKSVWEDQESNPIQYVDLNQRSEPLKICLNRGGMLLIRGESGSGKSRLLKEFYNSLEVIPRMIYYDSHPTDEQIPYQALVGGLRKVVSQNEWNTLSPVYAKVLYPLFPEIQEIRNDIDSKDLTLARNMRRLIPEAFLALVKILTRQRKVIFFFDDAQWCDPDSMQILSYIHEHGNPEEIGSAILTTNFEVKNNALDKFFSRFRNTRFVDVIEIKPLTDDEVAEITFTLIGRNPSAEEMVWLSTECGGNPELLIAILQTIKANEKKLYDCVKNDTFSIDQLLEESIQTRFGLLNKVQQKILSGAAVLGRQFSPEVLEIVSSAEPDVLESALQLFKEARIIRAVKFSNGDIGYEFIHGVIFRYVLQLLSPETRHLLNLRAAAAYNNQTADTLENQFSAARHCEEAGLLDEAFHHWISAGEKAKKNFLNTQVNLAFGNALRIAQLLGDRCSNEEYYGLVRSWSDFAFDVSDLGICEVIYARAMQMGQERRNERLIAFAESGKAIIEASRGNNPMAMELLNHSIERIKNSSCVEELARSYIIRGVLLTLLGDTAESIEDFIQASSIAAETENREMDNLVLFMTPYQVFSLCALGRAKEGKEIADRMVILARIWERPNYESIIKAASVIADFTLGNHQAALENLHTLDFEIKGFGIEWWGMLLKIIESKVYFDRGMLTASWELTKKIIQLSEGNVKYSMGLSYAYYLQGEIYRRLEDFMNAQQAYEKGLSLTNNQFIRIHLRYGLFLTDYYGSNGCKMRNKLEEILHEAEARQYLFFENIVLSAHLLFYGEEIGEDKFNEELQRLNSQVLALGQADCLPNISILEGINALRKGDTDYGLKKIKTGYEKAKKANNFIKELTALRLLVNYLPKNEEYLCTKRIYHKLMTAIKEESLHGDLETKAKKFINRQENLILV